MDFGVRTTKQPDKGKHGRVKLVQVYAKSDTHTEVGKSTVRSADVRTLQVNPPDRQSYLVTLAPIPKSGSNASQVTACRDADGAAIESGVCSRKINLKMMHPVFFFLQKICPVRGRDILK